MISHFFKVANRKDRKCQKCPLSQQQFGNYSLQQCVHVCADAVCACVCACVYEALAAVALCGCEVRVHMCAAVPVLWLFNQARGRSFASKKLLLWSRLHLLHLGTSGWRWGEVGRGGVGSPQVLLVCIQRRSGEG